MTSYVLAVDVGGTYTDVTLAQVGSSRVWSLKTPTTSTDPSIGFLAGAEKVLALAKAPPDGVVRVLHGTTTATNAILEANGAATGLLTTRGFKYVLEIGRHDAPHWINLLSWVKPQRPVTPCDVREVSGRIDRRGDELEPLSEDDCRAAACYFKDRGIQAIAICFLHSYADPRHELRARDVVAEEYPEALVSISSEVLPVFREYERSMATVLNSYVMPLVSTYVGRLQTGLERLSINAPLYIMKSNGGIIGSTTVTKQPALTALSGPAAGVIGAQQVGLTAGFEDLISIDVGGTSADVCLVHARGADVTTEGQIGDWPFAAPMIDIHTIGAGGGSIASVTASGSLVVGPASAGAQPGPACYGHGGTLPTVTDANLVLGRLPDGIAGGGPRLDVTAAREAIERHVARPLGMDIETAAAGIIEVIDNNMMGAIRVITVERGIDPRRFTLLGFGGAGPLHAASLGRLLDIPRVLIAPSPGVLSAMGLLASNIRNDFVRSCPMNRPAAEDVGALLKALDEQAFDWLAREGAPDDKMLVTWHADLRYANQVFELTIDLDRDQGQPDLERVYESFHAMHEQLYTFCLRESEVEIVNVRASAFGLIADGSRAFRRRLPQSHSQTAPAGRRPVYFHETGGFVDCPVYERSALTPTTRLVGPLVLDQMDTTTIVLPDQRMTVDSYGNVLIENSAAHLGVTS